MSGKDSIALQLKKMELISMKFSFMNCFSSFINHLEISGISNKDLHSAKIPIRQRF